MAYQANNIRGQWKRAFASATLVGFGGIGGIAGSTVFRREDQPTYHPGIWACIATNLLIVCIVAINTLISVAEINKLIGVKLFWRVIRVSGTPYELCQNMNVATSCHTVLGKFGASATSYQGRYVLE